MQDVSSQQPSQECPQDDERKEKPSEAIKNGIGLDITSQWVRVHAFVQWPKATLCSLQTQGQMHDSWIVPAVCKDINQWTQPTECVTLYSRPLEILSINISLHTWSFIADAFILMRLKSHLLPVTTCVPFAVHYGELHYISTWCMTLPSMQCWVIVLQRTYLTIHPEWHILEREKKKKTTQTESFVFLPNASLQSPNWCIKNVFFFLKTFWSCFLKSIRRQLL